MTPKVTRAERPRMRETEPLLTVRQVAELDCVSVKTVRRAIDAGLLEIIHVGPARRLIRIPAAAHRAYRAREC